MIKSHKLWIQEPKRAKKEPKRASFLKFNYGLKHWYTTNIDKDKTIKKVHKTLVFATISWLFMTF